MTLFLCLVFAVIGFAAGWFLRETKMYLDEALIASLRCECCGAPLVKVENGRATCRDGCSYDSAKHCPDCGPNRKCVCGDLMW